VDANRLSLTTPIDKLPGVGPVRARQLRSLEVFTVADLLDYFPRNYIRESAEGAIAEFRADQIHTVRGTIVAVDYISGHGRPRFEATLDDGKDKLSLAWFNAAYMRRLLHPGDIIRVRGKVKYFRSIPQMANPKWEKIEGDEDKIGEDKFRPIYSATANLSSEQIGAIIDPVLDEAVKLLEEWFDPALQQKRNLVSRREAYLLMHRPRNFGDAIRARKRIIFDELMLMQLGLGLSKRMRDSRLTAPVLRADKLLDERIRARFPFELTKGQQHAIWEILHDVRSGQPMNRLLQGDVGSGKTVVAVYAMLTAVANKLQSALLAPTEVLAEQHFLTLSNLLKDSSLRIELVTQRTKKETKGRIVKDLANGKIHLAIGTQAFLYRDVEFANLGLVVVDEQHKLGVRQRETLKSKGLSPHYLVMTATPIPRTLALSYFADFDLSVIDELPPGRTPIRTKWIKPEQSATAYQFVRQQVEQGRQAYIVVPQIEENGLDDTKSVKSHFEKLRAGPLSRLRLAMLHGQMKPEEKQATMNALRDGQIDVLVATTVIEVGIDVPNATVMLIENAERFGLSQLHQLRGRVGRGAHESYCVLLSPASTEYAEERLSAMVNYASGFAIAEMDMKLRGPGEFFGTRQHGLPQLKLADITQEIDMLVQCRDDAQAILAADPKLAAQVHRPLRDALQKQFGEAIGLAQIG
jgi:ATP-dependent DNA helicase RecG